MAEFAPPITRLPPDLAKVVRGALAKWNDKDSTRRLWERDARLWTGHDEAQGLGWLDTTSAQLAQIATLRDAAEMAKGFAHIVVLGVGGSSLCADVLARTFGRFPGHPGLVILDSTDPAQVRRVEASINLRTTLFLVSSKSGSSLEPIVLLRYFMGRVRSEIGEADAGARFIAVTDPGTKLEALAKAGGFRRIYHGVPSIGGRYAALSTYGMVPAAAMGVGVEAMLRRAQAMVDDCHEPDPAKNPGVALGIALGVLARFDRDKLTIVASLDIATIGPWLEQLLAESTGKLGKGFVPVDGEVPGPPGAYGTDRAFVYVRLANGADPEQDAAVEALASAGQPVIRVDVGGPLDIGAEFFRWQIATVVAASLLGVNPFDQPDIEASKAGARTIIHDYEVSGALPAESPIAAADGLSIFTDAANAEALALAAGGELTVESALRAHLGRISAGDYFALLLYVDMNLANEDAAQEIRQSVRDRRCVATCVGFGPRFLHSTGQAFKGGPATGVFLQVTCDDAADLPVAGQRCTFGVVKAAQARGDFAVLASKGRRVLRVHLGTDVRRGLQALRTIVAAALK